MSSPEPADHRSVLFLQQIDIKTDTRRNIRIKLQIDGRDSEIRRVEQTLTWIPSRSFDLSDASTIAVVIKAGHTIAGVSIGKLEALAELKTQEAIETFWNSEESISCKTTFDEQPAIVTFKLRPSPTLEATRASVRQLHEGMKTYRVLMSDSTEHTADLILKNGAVIAEMNPIVKVAFSVVTGVFEVLKERRKCDDAVSDLADSIGRILPYAELVIDDIVCEETELLEGVMTRLCTLIRDTASFVCDYVKQSPRRSMKPVISTDTSTKIKTFQTGFTRLEREFDRAVDVTTLKMAKKNDEFRLLDRLQPTNAAAYQDGRSCMEGTRTAVLGCLVAWTLRPPSQHNSPNCSNATNIYWLYGSPGLGKTYIANSLCNRLHGSKNLGGSFFCRRDDPILREPRRVLPTLISKLAGMWAPYRKLVARALQDDPQLNPESQRGEVLFSLLQSVQKHPPHALVLVIDALDECGDPGTRKRLLRCLLEASSRVSWIKIVITSRPEHDIKTFSEQNHIESIDIAEDDQSHEDIQLFTRRRMASIASSRNLPTDWPGKERIRQIADRSGGLFIFVETLCRFVDDPNPKPLLSQVLDAESGEANAELDKLYAVAITSAIGKSKEEFRSFVQAIVVVATYRPLPDETLAGLTGLDRGVVCSWVDGLSSILYRDRSVNGGIRVRHLSVIEFLTGPACPSGFRVVLGRANEELSVRCLTTMTKELKFNICELESSCLANTEIQNLNDRVRLRISDALQYSCMYWASHLCTTFEAASMEVCALLDSLFRAWRLLHWVEALSLMGKVPIAISALRTMKSCAKKFQHRHQDLVVDALRFLLAFSTPISTSAPQIYISALAFSPAGSSLWKDASKASPKLMRVYEGRSNSWPAPSGTWVGHQQPICSLSFSPDGRYVASGSRDNAVRIWDAESGAAVGEPLTGHANDVMSIAYSPDSRYIVSGSRDNTIRIWDAESGAAVSEPLCGHTGDVYSVTYSPDGSHIVSGSRDSTIRIWDVGSGAAVGKPLSGHTDHVYGVAYSPKGRYIVSGSADKLVRIWDAELGAGVGEPLRGHTGIVWSVGYSPDGCHVASGSRDNTVRIWDVESGVAVSELKGHTGTIWSLSYSPDGHYIASGSSDDTIRIWDAESGVIVGEPLCGHTGGVLSVAYSPDGCYVAAGSMDNTIRIWVAELGAAVDTPWSGHSDAVCGLAYRPDGRYIASCARDHTVRIWDAKSGAAVGEPLSGHTKGVMSVAYSPDSRYIVSGAKDNTVRIWDAESGAAVGDPLTGHTYDVYSVAYSPDSRYIVSGSRDNTIRIWDAESGATVGEPLEGHTGHVFSVAYSPDGRYIVSGSVDRTVRNWNAKSGVEVGSPLRGHSAVVWTVAYSPRGHYVASGSADWTVRLWAVKSGESKRLRGHTGTVWSVAYSRDGRYIVSGSSDNTIRIWDTESGVAVGGPLGGHTDMVFGVSYSPDGRHIASGSVDKTIRIWDAEAGETVHAPSSRNTDQVYSVAYSPDGHCIVSGSVDGTVQIWDAELGMAVGKPLWGHTSSILSVTYSPDGRCVVSGSADGTLRIWDVESGVMIGEPLRGHTRAVYSVAYSPDGHYIVSGSADNTVRIWDAASREEVGDPLSGHTDKVGSVAYSPDGQYIVSGSSDTTVRIWDAASREAVGNPLSGHTDEIASVAYSPNGHYVASASTDGTIRVWEVELRVPVGEPLRHGDCVLSIAYSPDGRRIVSGSSDNTVMIWDVESGEAVGEPLRGHTGSLRSVAYSPDNQHVVSGSDDATIRIWDAGIELENDRHTVLHAFNHPIAHSTNPNIEATISPRPLSAFSCSAIPMEYLNSNGWVVGAEGLLFWVPEDCRYGLTHLPVMTVRNMHRDRRVRIDFSDFRYGTSWTEILDDNFNSITE